MKICGLTRHPVKGIGREALDRVHLEADRPMRGDRAWAIAHEGCADRSGAWRPRGDFLVVASGPNLAAVTAESDGDRITLAHPDRPRSTFSLPADAPALMDWVRPLWPEERPAPCAVLGAPSATGMPDNGKASLAILTTRSLAAVSEAAGRPIDAGRFRANLLIDGVDEPWEEFSWVGRRLRVGSATLEVIEPIERCRATEANPETGQRDINMLSILRDAFGHRHFGVYARVVESGNVRIGDAAALVSPAPDAPVPPVL